MHSDELIPVEVIERARAVRSASRMNPHWQGSERNFDLTDREMQVLLALAEGMENREIGEALLIGRNTVMSHIKRVLAKMGARNRTHAVAIGFKTGILEVERNEAPQAS